jgi:hypothetical protein
MSQAIEANAPGESGWAPPAYAKIDTFVERALTVGDAPFELPGILSLPRGAGSFPGVVLVHASSRHDADETIGGVKFFKDLAWGLASAGIAVLRYEKRTKRYPDVTEQAGFTVKEAVIDDAVSAIERLAVQPEVDGERVVVLGHAVGGMLGPRIALESGKVAAIGILAANSRPIDVVTAGQLDYLLRLIERAPPPMTAPPVAAPTGRQLHNTIPQLALLRKLVDQMRNPNLRPDEILEAGDMRVAGSYFIDLRSYDPMKTARAIGIPILVAHAARDYQITAADLEGWRVGLADRARTTIQVYEGLNHMFVAGGGASTPEEYLRPDHVAPQLVEDLAAFVKSTARSSPTG